MGSVETILFDWPYLGLFVYLLLCGIGFPGAEEVALLAGGVMIASGKTTWSGTFLVLFVGVLLGDGLLYFFGRRYGRRLMLLRPFRRFLRPRRMRRVRLFFERYGRRAVFVARFLPTVRSATFFTAGRIGMPVSRFALWNGLAMLISIPPLVVLGYFAGDRIGVVRAVLSRIDLAIAIGVAIGVASVLMVRRRRTVSPQTP